MSGRVRRKLDIVVFLVDAFGRVRVLESRLDACERLRSWRVSSDFIWPYCENRWSMEADADGLFDGYGLPPCPECGTNGRRPERLRRLRLSVLQT